jgi:predicted kinase
VIVDAVHLRACERDEIAQIATNTARFAGIWLIAPKDLSKARVEARVRDASDATAEVVESQASFPVGENSWLPFDASQPPDVLVRNIADAVI